MTPEQRFWAKVDKSSPTECWIWKAAKHRNGYGNFWTGKRPMLAHRYAYTILVGPILTGLQIDHLCRNRACVNPAHMEPVTLQEKSTTRPGVLVVCAQRSHCVRGHELTVANTYQRERGTRECRLCHRDDEREHRARARVKPNHHPLDV